MNLKIKTSFADPVFLHVVDLSCCGDGPTGAVLILTCGDYSAYPHAPPYIRFGLSFLITDDLSDAERVQQSAMIVNALLTNRVLFVVAFNALTALIMASPFYAAAESIQPTVCLEIGME